MATHTGSEGTVKLGTVGADTAIGEIRSFTISETADTIEDTTMGDTSRTYAVGLKTFSGSVECYFDPDDAKQDEMVAGASLTLTDYPEGSDSADQYISGSVIITSADVSSSADGMVEASFSFQGTGAVTRGAV
jgi:hypothetical protein